MNPSLHDDGFFRNALKIVIWVLTAISRSWEVIIRKQMGERYLTWLGLLGSFAVVMVYASFYPSKGFGLYLFLFVGCGLWRRWEVWRRKRRHIRWHSRSAGESYLLKPFLSFTGKLRELPAVRDNLNLDRITMLRIVEPAAGFLLAFAVRAIDPTLSTWLLIASGTLFVKNQLIWSQAYDRHLDTVDAQIEAEYGQAALEGAPLGEVAGVQVIARVAQPVARQTTFAGD